MRMLGGKDCILTNEVVLSLVVSQVSIWGTQRIGGGDEACST